MDGLHATITPDLETIRAHLELLFRPARIAYPDGQVEIAYADGAGQVTSGQMFDLTTKGLDDAAEFAWNMNQSRRNTYVGVNPRKATANPGRRASTRDVEIAFHHFVDCDRADSADRLRFPPVPYSFCVLTGRTPSPRPQGYWTLDTPTRDLDAWSSQQRALAITFGGDAVIDPPRIMRLAGTVNWPTADKQARGYVVERVGLIDKATPPVTGARLWEAYPGIVQAASAESWSDAPTSGLNLDAGTDPVALLRSLGAGNWHNTVLRLVGHWIEIGLPDYVIETMAPALTLPGYMVEDTLREIRVMIRGGREKWNKPDTGPQPVEEAPAADATPDEPIIASTLYSAPPEREWLVPNWIPLRTVTSLYGDGGTGKTLLAQQLATASAIGGQWIGLDVRQMPVLAVLCEDDRDELHRRHHAICTDLSCLMHPGLSDLRLWPRTGSDNLLVTYDREGRPLLTPFFARVVEQVAAMPAGDKLVILDTVADLYGGNEIVRSQVNHFVKAVVGKLVKDHGATVLLLAHPSVAGMNSKSGLSGSTAWNGAVRSRLYLTKDEEADDERILTRMKANYAKAGPNEKAELEWVNGTLKLKGHDTVTSIEKQARLNALKDGLLIAIKERAAAGLPYSDKRTAGNYIGTCEQANGYEKLMIDNAIIAMVKAGKVEIRDRQNVKQNGIWTIQRGGIYPKSQ